MISHQRNQAQGYNCRPGKYPDAVDQLLCFFKVQATLMWNMVWPGMT